MTTNSGDDNRSYKPKDRDLGFPSKMSTSKRRFFEILPGFLTWTLLLLPVIFALFKWDTAFVIYIAYLVAYWTFRTFQVSHRYLHWFETIKERFKYGLDGEDKGN